MNKLPPLIGTSTRPPAGTRTRKRILVDGREIPGLIAAYPERSLAIVHQLDTHGRPITDPDGKPIRIRRAGRIEIEDVEP